MLRTVDRGEQRAFGAGAEIGALAAQERDHRRLPGGRGVMERRAAAGGSKVDNFRVGVDQFGCPRDVAGFGGFEDVRFGFLGHLSVDGGGGGSGRRAEYKTASGVSHGAILEAFAVRYKTGRIIFV